MKPLPPPTRKEARKQVKREESRRAKLERETMARQMHAATEPQKRAATEEDDESRKRAWEKRRQEITGTMRIRGDVPAPPPPQPVEIKQEVKTEVKPEVKPELPKAEPEPEVEEKEAVIPEMPPLEPGSPKAEPVPEPTMPMPEPRIPLPEPRIPLPEPAPAIPTQPSRRQEEHVGNFALNPPTVDLTDQINTATADLAPHNREIITNASNQAGHHVDVDGDLDLVMPELDIVDETDEPPSERFAGVPAQLGTVPEVQTHVPSRRARRDLERMARTAEGHRSEQRWHRFNGVGLYDASAAGFGPTGRRRRLGQQPPPDLSFEEALLAEAPPAAPATAAPATAAPATAATQEEDADPEMLEMPDLDIVDETDDPVSSRFAGHVVRTGAIPPPQTTIASAELEATMNDLARAQRDHRSEGNWWVNNGTGLQG